MRWWKVFGVETPFLGLMKLRACKNHFFELDRPDRVPIGRCFCWRSQQESPLLSWERRWNKITSGICSLSNLPFKAYFHTKMLFASSSAGCSVFGMVRLDKVRLQIVQKWTNSLAVSTERSVHLGFHLWQELTSKWIIHLYATLMNKAPCWHSVVCFML